jgi:hypothetical protein
MILAAAILNIKLSPCEHRSTNRRHDCRAHNRSGSHLNDALSAAGGEIFGDAISVNKTDALVWVNLLSVLHEKSIYRAFHCEHAGLRNKGELK